MSFNNSSTQLQNESSSIDMRDALTTPHSDQDNPFAFTPDQLAALQDPKNIQLLHTYGGLQGVAKGLHADIQSGLDPATVFTPHITLHDITLDKQQIKDRIVGNEDHEIPSVEEDGVHHVGPYAKRATYFGANVLPPVNSKNLFQLMWIAFNDKTLVNISLISSLVVKHAINLKYLK